MNKHNPDMTEFERHITYRVREEENGRLILAAEMTDRFHDIALTVSVDLPTLTVRHAQAEFRRFPSPNCPHAAQALQCLSGLVIGKGLSKSINAALGGSAGCGNLRTLLLGLLPLALNVRASSGCQTDAELLRRVHEQLQGTCIGYARPPHSDE